MGGFEFGVEDEIHDKLLAIVQSDAYRRSVAEWERRNTPGALNGVGVNGSGGLNGNGPEKGKWGSSVSASSLASFGSSASAYDGSTVVGGERETPKKNKRFSGLGFADFYRRKLFSSSPTSPGGSPSPSNSHLGGQGQNGYGVSV